MFSIVDRAEASHLNLPTITYPNGGEEVYTRTIEVVWHSPTLPSDVLGPVLYEIFFTSQFTDEEKGEWSQIAVVPAASGTFNWTVPFSIKSEKCRIGIRARDHKGLRTPLTISADNFSIKGRLLATPAVTSPVDGASYHNYVPVAIDHAGVSGSQSQRATYQVFYSSEANGLDWTLVRDNVTVGSLPFLWDVRDIPPGTDYSLKIVLADDKGDTSLPVFINNLKVRSLDYFVVDTIPPKGRITIESDSEYTSERNLIVRLDAYDETTDVKSVTLQQTFNDETKSGVEQEMANVKSWYLLGEDDGVYCVQSLFKDYAGNVPTTDDSSEFFRRYAANNDVPVTAFLLVSESGVDSAYIAYGGDNPALYLGKELQFALDGEATSLIKFNGSVYVAIKTANNTGTLQKIEDGAGTDVYEFAGLDSAITAMAEYNEMLYLGLQNGEVYSFNGTSMTLIDTFDSQIETLATDKRVLYVFVENETSVRVYDGTSFSIAGISDGNLQI